MLVVKFFFFFFFFCTLTDKMLKMLWGVRLIWYNMIITTTQNQLIIQIGCWTGLSELGLVQQARQIQGQQRFCTLTTDWQSYLRASVTVLKAYRNNQRCELHSEISSQSRKVWMYLHQAQRTTYICVLGALVFHHFWVLFRSRDVSGISPDMFIGLFTVLSVKPKWSQNVQAGIFSANLLWRWHWNKTE